VASPEGRPVATATIGRGAIARWAKFRRGTGFHPCEAGLLCAPDASAQ
jgi:hypothetical protein